MLDRPAQTVVDDLAGLGIVAGVALGEDYPELGDGLLVCATETKSHADIERFVTAMRDVKAAHPPLAEHVAGSV